MGSGLCLLCNHYKYFQCRAPRRGALPQRRPTLHCTTFEGPLLPEMLGVDQVLTSLLGRQDVVDGKGHLPPDKEACAARLQPIISTNTNY
jgi:hypothetical protein